ncbi:MAG: PglZ domain-containing protein [Acidobacteria bacterium]|nr:PglZ domain-containing protein [Acidobacteriota bacterium]
MKIAEYIQTEIFLARLKQTSVLVVYDPERRYRELCHGLKTDTRIVIDASESSIESRTTALDTLRKLGEPNTKLEGMIVYVPAKRPANDPQRQHDPFTLYEACGSVFPRLDDDGDEYLTLCLKAKPDYATEIRKIFAENPAPSFDVIDAIGGGQNWPLLRATLKAESAYDILIALLAPTETQSNALKEQEGWSKEARDLLKATIGLELKTRGKTWSPIAEELWRFLLFSEFVFDLPGELPPSLATVPCAKREAKTLINDVCDRLRSDVRYRAKYIEEAERIEKEFDLPNQCRTIEDLGERDTFYFEERTFLRRAIEGLSKNDLDVPRQYLSRHKRSVWLSKGESQEQWELIQAALKLIEACDVHDNQLPEHQRTQTSLIDFYVSSLREVDQLQREFEQSVGDFHDPYELMTEVVNQARKAYRRLIQKVQTAFVRHLETQGWPPEGRLVNGDVFDRFVGERLKDRGKRVAYFMVDALRYELGVALEKLLEDDGAVELHAAFAQLPTITPVGMASLLPGAKADLTLEYEKESLVPKLAGQPVTNVTQRMDVLRKRFGDMFAEMTLNDFVRGRPRIAPTVTLFVLRSTEIDSQLENNPETTLGLIPSTLNMIRAALHKLRGLGFHEAVIVTDHGFFLNTHAEAGDVCQKPQGNWLINAHDRMLLGTGDSDNHSTVIVADRLGIRGTFAKCAVPRSYAPYRDGHLYFHGGASLAEAVVPVLVMRLEAAATDKQKFKVEMNYKNGAKRITTRLPVIDITVYTDDLFAQELEVLLEAQNEKGDVVGEPRPGGEVNAATGTITIKPNQSVQVVLRMHADNDSKVIVKALNPKTMAAYSSLNLETDYTV